MISKKSFNEIQVEWQRWHTEGRPVPPEWRYHFDRIFIALPPSRKTFEIKTYKRGQGVRDLKSIPVNIERALASGVRQSLGYISGNLIGLPFDLEKKNITYQRFTCNSLQREKELFDNGEASGFIVVTDIGVSYNLASEMSRLGVVHLMYELKIDSAKIEFYLASFGNKQHIGTLLIGQGFLRSDSKESLFVHPHNLSCSQYRGEDQYYMQKGLIWLDRCDRYSYDLQGRLTDRKRGNIVEIQHASRRG